MTRQRDAGAIRITAPRLLLVEGRDEELFFSALMSHGLARNSAQHQIIALGGKDSFRGQLLGLATAIRAHPVASLGVVRDGDEDARRALQSVADALAAAGFSKPDSHAAFVGTKPRVGVFVMPDGQNRGALEALCRRSVEGEAAACVADYLKCLQDRDVWGTAAPRNTAQRDKAFVHAYLASRKNPVARTGEGAQQRVWNFGHSAFEPVKDFLSRLLAPPG